MSIFYIDRDIEREMVVVISSSILLFAADALRLRRKLVVQFAHLRDELRVCRGFCYVLYLCVASSFFCMSVFSFHE
jgi:hypothetical protein